MHCMTDLAVPHEYCHSHFPSRRLYLQRACLVVMVVVVITHFWIPRALITVLERNHELLCRSLTCLRRHRQTGDPIYRQLTQ